MYTSFFDELEKIAVAEEAKKPNWKKRLAIGGAALGTAAAIGLAVKRGRGPRVNPYLKSARTLQQQTDDIGRRISKAERGVKEYKRLLNEAENLVSDREYKKLRNEAKNIVSGLKTKRGTGKVIDLAEVRKARGLS